MGTPLPPNEPGFPCNVCWGPGTRFGIADTPKFITAQLFDIQQGEFWEPADEQLLLTPHLLEQLGPGCIWRLNDGTFLFQFLFAPSFTQLNVSHFPSASSAFIAFEFPACLLEVPSVLLTPAGNFGFAGNAVITWNPEGLS